MSEGYDFWLITPQLNVANSVATALPHRQATSQREGRIVFMAASRRRAPRPLNNPRGNSRVPTPILKNGARRSALCES
jgi:hypothetical protein